MRLVAMAAVCCGLGIQTACVFEKAGTATLKSNPSAVVVNATISEDGQEVLGTLSSASGEIQTLTAPAGSSISGIQTSFPPGAISVDTQISMAPGANITSLDEIASIGLGQGNQVQQVGAAVSIESAVPFNAAVPFSVAISIAEAGLHLQEGFNNFAVVYKAKDVDANALKYGVIPASEITIVNGKAIFSTRYFGTYQLIKTEAPIVARQETKVATLVADSPAVIHDTMPMIADGGRQVTLTGKGFTGKTVITIAGLPVRQLNVRSDVQASFVVPEKVPFGFTTVEAEQAGVKNSYPLLARSADKLSLPLITMEPSGVCAGINYYDANGVQQKGTKACEGGSSGSKSGYADTAGYADVAGEAIFARGKLASPVVAATSVVLPKDGDYVEVSGGGLIKNFGIGSKGQFIKIEFKGDIVVAGQMSTPKLILADEGPLVATPGAVLLLLGTGDGWREIGRDEPSVMPVFYGVVGSSSFVQDTNLDSASYQSFKFDHVSFDSAHFTYNTSNGELKAVQGGYYRMAFGMALDAEPAFTDYFQCKIGFVSGGQFNISQYGMSGSNRSECIRKAGSEDYGLDPYQFGQNQSLVPAFSAFNSMMTTTSGMYKFRLRSKPNYPVFIKLYPAPAPVGGVSGP